ncbi:MAG: gliding motility-associated C-terminal domain-containing protein [Saprospiraceae bacterium]|nr:gliding motility-associated C-terminal domain-containing protein [Saprospiraceae bacterium]
MKHLLLCFFCNKKHILNCILIGLLGIIISGCISHKNIETENIQKKCTWGIQRYITDSLGNHYKIYDKKTSCFPGLSEYENNIIEIDLKIYNRSGMLVFETNQLNENWICSDSSICNINDGIYIYWIKTIEKGDTLYKRDHKGTIGVFNY